MEKFSIDLKASDKGERKKAVKYLKSKGLLKKYNDKFKGGDFNYIFIELNEFNYCHGTEQEIILVLPRDWDILVEIVNEDRKEMKVSCDKILSKAKKSEAKIAFDNMFGNFKSDLETLLEI